MEVDEKNIRMFQDTLEHWWRDDNVRVYSWRLNVNRTPYRALIAELMLRRTRADQVEPIYNQFVALYPILPIALTATDQEIREIVYPLGLRQRASEIIALFEMARKQHMVDFPVELMRLIQLPGVGDYVGNAVACFAGNDMKATLIDTNVVRVLGRIFDLDISGEARRRKSVIEVAVRAVDRKNIANYHYSILDFAALTCKAKSPLCPKCPFAKTNSCSYFSKLSSGLLNRETE